MAINPLKFLLGLAKLAFESGVKIYENNPVIKIEKKGRIYNVITKGGSIKAKKIVIASNGFYRDDLVPQLNNRILPAITEESFTKCRLVNLLLECFMMIYLI